jgi:transposase
MRAALQAQINKTDRNDARGIAQMMRVGLHRPVHVKTLHSQKLRMLLTHRKRRQAFVRCRVLVETYEGERLDVVRGG